MKVSHFREGLGHGDRTVQELCHRSTDSSAYCSSCAADIMAKALNPFFGGKWEKTGRHGATRASKPSAHQRLFR